MKVELKKKPESIGQYPMNQKSGSFGRVTWAGWGTNAQVGDIVFQTPQFVYNLSRGNEKYDIGTINICTTPLDTGDVLTITI